MVNLDRCSGSCNTFDDPSSRICVPKKTEDANLNDFNMIARMNESKVMKKNIHHANLNVHLMVENAI